MAKAQKSDLANKAVAADNLPKRVIAGIQLEIDNETKEEEKEVKDISGIEISTEPNANKVKENKPEVILDQIVGIPNIDTDDAGKPEPKAQLSPPIHVDSMTGLLR